MRHALFALFLSVLTLIGLVFYHEYSNPQIEITKNETTIISSIKKKISTYKVPSRVEVRNYVQDSHHKYQNDITQIKKMKIKLDPTSDVYLELNLFVNETDANAPLVAQFMLFDVKTQNLIQEDNLNLE